MIPPDLQKIDGPHIEGIEELLGVKGVGVAPQQSDKSHVAFTMELGQGGFGRMSRLSKADDNRAINGVSSVTLPILGPSGWTISGLAVFMAASKQAGRIIGLNVGINFDAAGAAAFAGKVIRVTYRYVDFLNSGASCVINESNATVAAGTLGYNLPIDLNWRGLVPWDMGLQALVSSVDGTVFPANSVASTRCSAWVAKLGKQLPL